MVFLGRKTRFHNNTQRSISINPLRCLAGHELEGQKIIIEPGKVVKVKSTKFCFEETIPGIHGFLNIQMVGTNHTAAITAHHVRVCVDIFVNGDEEMGLTVTAITELLWDYTPFSWIPRNKVGRKPVQVYPKPEGQPINSHETAGAAVRQRS